MSSAAVTAAPQGAAAGQGQQQAQPSMLMTVVRMAIFWYFISNFFSKKTPKDPALLMRNLFQKGEDVDMWVYISEDADFNNFNDESALVWSESNIKYAEYGLGGERALDITYIPTKTVQNNGSIWAHAFFARSGYSPHPRDPAFERASTWRLTHSLIEYRPKPKVDRRKNLLGASLTEEGAAANAAAEEEEKQKKVLKETVEEDEEVEEDDDEEAEEKADAPVEFISYWKPNLTINFVEDFTRYHRGQVPEPVRPFMTFDLETGNYFPTTVVTEFWLLKDKLIPINETVTALPLSMTLSPLALWKWQLYINMEVSFKMQRDSMGAMDGEADTVKRVLLEGNPVLLAITVAVSLLHTVFDFLTFKNDIQFWNQNKSMEGLSARSVVINFFCQLVIFLYLLDNETSWMIILSSGMSVCIEFWKIGKAMKITIDRSGSIPMLRFSDRDSYANNKTKEYDEIATRYMSYALYPLVACYAVYSLVFETHKSWYSWLLSSLTGCVYTFGFIMMCPQLFINYKLKSVAHLPWRQMTYKFLNTIIDDLFAFVIKMPLMHRLSVFRDDIIFLIYLYQRWIYPVDKKRVNEFGFGGPEAEAAAAGAPALEAKAATEGDSSQAETTAGAAGEDSSDKSKVGISEEGLTKRGAPKGKGKKAAEASSSDKKKAK